MTHRSFSLAILALLFSACGIFAQTSVVPEPEPSTPPAKNIIKMSPFHFVDATFLIGYERMLGNYNSSIFIQAGMHSKENSWDGSVQFGFQEELQYRIYVTPPSPNAGDFFSFKGLYFGPYAFHRYRDQTVQEWDWILQQNISVKERINEVAGGLVMGAQFALADKFYIDFYLGGGVKRSFGRSESNNFVNFTQPGYNGVLPKIGLLMGFGL